MRHRAERRQILVEREQHVARPDEFFADAVAQRDDHALLPVAREAAAGSVVGDAEFRFRYRVQQLDLAREPPLAFAEVGFAVDVAVVYLGDDREHRHFEHDRAATGP